MLGNFHIVAQDTQPPSNEEIKLLLNELDQAMLQYERLTAHQNAIFGHSDNVDVGRQLLELWKTLKADISKDPQKFNSSRGFDVVVTADDASRNGVLVAKLALVEMLEQLHTGKGAAPADALSKLMQEADVCGSSFLKASESAADLYTRYLHWQDATSKKPAVAPAPKPPTRKSP
jgi:hypothetical protein